MTTCYRALMANGLHIEGHGYCNVSRRRGRAVVLLMELKKYNRIQNLRLPPSRPLNQNLALRLIPGLASARFLGGKYTVGFSSSLGRSAGSYSP